MSRAGSRRHVTPRRRARAQSSVEYLIVLSLLALALSIGPDSALEQLFRAFADHYQKFTYAMSRP
jgi:hypothetical protein